ncbi:hypothetical protein BgiBS90_032890, partial [Biomphalaria glabrata]
CISIVLSRLYQHCPVKTISALSSQDFISIVLLEGIYKNKETPKPNSLKTKRFQPSINIRKLNAARWPTYHEMGSS